MKAPPPFLRGDSYVLTPLDDADALLLRGRAHLPADLDEILLTVRNEDGEAFALCGLSPIDWTSRTATVFCTPSSGDHAADAFAMLTRYALDELALESVTLDMAEDADVPPGYTQGPRGWRLERPLP